MMTIFKTRGRVGRMFGPALMAFATGMIVMMVALPPRAQGFGDDNESGDWLPIPDGFVWPPSMPEGPAFAPVSKPFKGLRNELTQGIDADRADGSRPERIEVFECDLNGDGESEVFVSVPSYSGTGGTFFQILSPEGDGYRRVGEIQGWGIQFHKAKDGWFQIEGMTRGGGGIYSRYLLGFNGREYEIIRQEKHDFNRGRVEIIK